jgi:hypothetical protein
VHFIVGGLKTAGRAFENRRRMHKSDGDRDLDVFGEGLSVRALGRAFKT